MLLFSRQSIFEFLRDSLFFAVDNEGMEHTDAEHIRNGIERQIREPKLYREESSHDKTRKSDSTVSLLDAAAAFQHIDEGVQGHESKQQNLQYQHDVSERFSDIGAVFVDRKQERIKRVHDDLEQEDGEESASDIDQNASELRLRVYVGDRELRPEQEASCERDEVEERVDVEEGRQLEVFDNPP